MLKHYSFPTNLVKIKCKLNSLNVCSLYFDDGQSMEDIVFIKAKGNIEAACAELKISSAASADVAYVSQLKTFREQLKRPIYIRLNLSR